MEESVAACAAEAKSFKEAGFRAVKMKVGLLPVSEDLRRVQATREAIGQIVIRSYSMKPLSVSRS